MLNASWAMRVPGETVTSPGSDRPNPCLTLKTLLLHGFQRCGQFVRLGRGHQQAGDVPDDRVHQSPDGRSDDDLSGGHMALTLEAVPAGECRPLRRRTRAAEYPRGNVTRESGRGYHAPVRWPCAELVRLRRCGRRRRSPRDHEFNTGPHFPVQVPGWSCRIHCRAAGS